MGKREAWRLKKEGKSCYKAKEMDIQRVHGALIFIQRVHGIGKKKTALQNKAVVYTIVFFNAV